MVKFASKEDLREERERLINILQDMRVLTRDLEDFREQRRYKKKIRTYEQEIQKIERELDN